jgi:3-oxoacyl-(acyl-carrier-protein) synthase
MSLANTSFRVVGQGQALPSEEEFRCAKTLLRAPKAWKAMETRARLLFLASFRAADAAGGFLGWEEDGGIAVEVGTSTEQALVPFRDLDPLWLLRQLPNMPAAHLAIESGWKGPCQTFAAGNASRRLEGGAAADQARRWLRRGEARRVVVAKALADFAVAEIWEGS